MMMMMMMMIIIIITEMYDHTSNNWSHRNSHEKLQENLEAVPGKHSIDNYEIKAIGTPHIIRKVLQCEA